MLDQNIYSHELAMCRELKAKQQGCAWGKCASCGVPFLLEKLGKGRVIENLEEVRMFRDEIFKN